MQHTSPQHAPSFDPGTGCQGTGSVDVYSCGMGHSRHLEERCHKLAHVFAADKLLDQYGIAEEARHNLKPSPKEALAEAVRLAASGAHVGLLASGDALYHGLGSTFLQVLADLYPGKSLQELPFAVCFHAGITAFQRLCHKEGLAWSEAQLFSVHSGTGNLWSMLQAKMAIIYCGRPWTAARLAEELLAVWQGAASRPCLVAENLDTASERIVRTNLQEAAALETGPTSILVLLPGGHSLPLPLGLADASFHFENHCLTNRYIRPVVLSCLRLPAQGVLWDLGAGSGSVGLEAALLQRDLQVCAVEQVDSRCDNILANKKRLGVANLELVRGDILQSMPVLPRPNRIFVGGGGRDLVAIIRQGLTLLDQDDPLARVVVTAITLESVAELTQFAAQLARGEADKSTGCPKAVCEEAVSLDIAARHPMAGGRYSYLAPANRIHLFSFRPGV